MSVRNFDYYPWSSLQMPNPPNVPDSKCPPKPGYTIQSEIEMASIRLGNTQQVFTRLPTATFPENNNQYKELDTCQLPSKSEILWLVTVNAIEVTQVADDPVSYLRTNQIINFANNDPPRYSIFQARIRWSDGSAYQHYKYVDIKGGSSFQVFGRGVSVDLLAPNPTYYIVNGEQSPSANPSIPQLDGLVVNAIVSARIAPLIVPKTSYDIQKFTVNANSVGGGGGGGANPQFVKIPPGALRVKVYNCNAAVVPSDMLFVTGTTLVGWTDGVLNFPAGSDSTEYLEIPGGATHIYTGANASFFKFVFIIDP